MNIFIFIGIWHLLSQLKRHRYRERLRKKILVKRSYTMKFCVELLSLRQQNQSFLRLIFKSIAKEDCQLI